MYINLKSDKIKFKSFNLYKLSFFVCLKILIIINILSVSCHQLNKNSKYEVKLNCENNWMNIKINLRSKLNESLITKEKDIKNENNFQITKGKKDKNESLLENLKKEIDVINQNLTIKSFNLSDAEHDNQKVKTIQNQDNLKQELLSINDTIKDKILFSKFVSNKNFTTKINIKQKSLENLDQNVKSLKSNNEIDKLKIYLEGWEHIPKCSPKINYLNNSYIHDKSLYEFSLSLKPLEETEINCGLIRMRNKITDDLEFQHTIIIEYNENIYDNKNENNVSKSIKKKDALLVYCKMPEAKFYQAFQTLWWSNKYKKESANQRFLKKKQIQQFIEHFKQEKKNKSELIISKSKKNSTVNNFDIKIRKNNKLNITNKLRIKRDSSFLDNFPTNFTETVEELIDYSGNFTGSGPIPKLHIAVRQNGEFVNSSLDVHPGTPLEMVIYLDEKSAQVYGLLVSFLKVTDNNSNKIKQQEEIIILDGCSIDQYIFGNFESIDNGKSILAKFRAFKFPESNYVLFVGTVNLCIGQCTPVVCAGSDQQFSYGRRRRRDLNIQSQNFFFNVTLAPSVAGENKKINKTKKTDFSKSNQFVTNKVFEVEMSTIIKVSKPKEKSSLIKNEFKKNSDLTLFKKNNFIKRPIITRKFKKRFDSNEFLGKKNHISSTKMYLTSNYSNKMNYGFSYFFFMLIFHFFFS